MTRERRLLAGVVVIAVLAHAPGALASPWAIASSSERGAPNGGLRRGGPSIDETADASRREAAAAFADGEAAFDRGEYELAAERFGRAHALLPHPWTLYNLALSRSRSGDVRGAWLAFDELGHRAATPEDRSEAQAERDALRPLLAFVQVHGDAGGIACIDGVQLELDARGEAEAVLVPGTHRLAAPKSDRTVELAAGTTTRLDARPAAQSHRPRARGWLIAASAMSGLALGGSIGAAAVTDAPLGRGLAGAAAGASAVALAGTIAALVIIGKRTAKAPAFTCRGG